MFTSLTLLRRNILSHPLPSRLHRPFPKQSLSFNVIRVAGVDDRPERLFVIGTVLFRDTGSPARSTMQPHISVAWVPFTPRPSTFATQLAWRDSGVSSAATFWLVPDALQKIKGTPISTKARPKPLGACVPAMSGSCSEQA